MSSDAVLDICREALIVSGKIAGPFLLVVLVIGVVVGLLQSITQLQEPTLSFVPKLLGAALVLLVAGWWMLGVLMDFARSVITAAPQLIGG